MNELIRKLSNQAWAWIDQQEDYADATEFGDLLDKKFAELIIKECLSDLKERIALRYQGSEKDRDIGYGMEIVYYDIVDKFGVEE